MTSSRINLLVSSFPRNNFYIIIMPILGATTFHIIYLKKCKTFLLWPIYVSFMFLASHTSYALFCSNTLWTGRFFQTGSKHALLYAKYSINIHISLLYGRCAIIYWTTFKKNCDMHMPLSPTWIRLYRETAVNSLEWSVTTYNKIFRVKLGNSSWNSLC
jgi:hypothetical protein